MERDEVEPVERLGHLSTGPPLVGERVEEGVRRGVVALPRRAERRGRRGEEDEEVQRLLPREPVEIPRPRHLGCQHALEACQLLLHERSIIEHARRMDEAPQGRQTLPQSVQQALHLLLARDIPGDDEDPRPLLL